MSGYLAGQLLTLPTANDRCSAAHISTAHAVQSAPLIAICHAAMLHTKLLLPRLYTLQHQCTSSFGDFVHSNNVEAQNCSWVAQASSNTRVPSNMRACALGFPSTSGSCLVGTCNNGKVSDQEALHFHACIVILLPEAHVSVIVHTHYPKICAARDHTLLPRSKSPCQGCVGCQLCKFSK